MTCCPADEGRQILEKVQNLFKDFPPHSSLTRCSRREGRGDSLVLDWQIQNKSVNSSVTMHYDIFAKILDKNFSCFIIISVI
jgi:hypothetical protein